MDNLPPVPRTKEEKHEAAKLKQQEKQAAAKLEAKKKAPATLVSFAFQVTAVCPVTENPVTLSGPQVRDWDVSDVKRLGDAPESEKPWNAPSVQLSPYSYALGDYTTDEGITLSIWHCPECGGHHDIDLT